MRHRRLGRWLGRLARGRVIGLSTESSSEGDKGENEGDEEGEARDYQSEEARAAPVKSQGRFVGEIFDQSVGEIDECHKKTGHPEDAQIEVNAFARVSCKYEDETEGNLEQELEGVLQVPENIVCEEMGESIDNAETKGEVEEKGISGVEEEVV